MRLPSCAGETRKRSRSLSKLCWLVLGGVMFLALANCAAAERRRHAGLHGQRWAYEAPALGHISQYNADRASVRLRRNKSPQWLLGATQPRRHAFLSPPQSSGDENSRADTQAQGRFTRYTRCKRTSKRPSPLRLATRFHDQGFNKDVIVGGNIDGMPGLLHNVENDEIREFTQEMWNKGVPINEAVERLNNLDGTQPDEVMDNFMFGNATMPADDEDDDDGDGGNYNAADVSESIKAATGHVPTLTTNNGDIVMPIGHTGAMRKTEQNKSDTVPGIIVPPEYIDEEQFRKETEKNDRDRLPDAGDLSLEDLDSDDDDTTGIEEVNYSALTNSELQLVTTLMQNKLEAPDSHEKILNELLASDKGGFTEDECRTYFDRFRRIGDILIALNKTVLMKPLDTEWIPEIQQRIRDFIARNGGAVASIKWTEHDVIVTLKEGESENRSSEIHEALATYLRTEAGNDLCPGIKNVGVLMCTATPDDANNAADNNTTGGCGRGRRRNGKHDEKFD